MAAEALLDPVGSGEGHADRRRTVLKEYVEYAGEFVSFGPSWAYPKPVQDHVPLVIGAGGVPRTFAGSDVTRTAG